MDWLVYHKARPAVNRNHREAFSPRVIPWWRRGIMSPMKAMSLKLPDEVDARLKAHARETGKTTSELTREALSRYLEAEGDSRASCLDLVRDLVGTAEGPGDLASNKKHVRGYGR